MVKKIFLALFFTQKVAFLIGTYHMLFFLIFFDSDNRNGCTIWGNAMKNGQDLLLSFTFFFVA